MSYIKDNMPKLTEEEQNKVLEYAWSIQDCINEFDKIYVYATELRQIYRTARMRERDIKLN
jgi:hypothetical protein